MENSEKTEEDTDKNYQEEVVNEPFFSQRDASRLLFDFSVMLSCVEEKPNKRILDFAAGSCWISEFLNRLGYETTSYDIAQDSIKTGQNRLEMDKRINISKMRFVVGDGHNMPFEDNEFSHTVCFDSLHHMADFTKALTELYRVIEDGGRAIFVEPGSEHSRSEATIEFIEKYKKDDPTWLERDIVLNEIYDIAISAGFKGMTIKPFLFPSQSEYTYVDWKHFDENDQGKKNLLRNLIETNNRQRVIFYLQK